ncbi:MAG: IS200/IS605 family transposase [Desulfobacterales bacterium]|jgi:putative transposase|nr:IS200/IS605 family transposase [Desulfobacterales bacterium]
MKDYQSQSHVKWECKYHIVWCPKYRRKKLYGRLRRRFGEIIQDLCRQKGVEVIEGHAQPDHVHICLSMPPKYSVSSIVGFLKGKSAIRLHKEFSKAKSTGKHFWIRGYFVSTVGLDEKAVREYIKHQELTDKRQINLPEFD